MTQYSFRTLTPDGTIVFESTNSARNIGEAIAAGLQEAKRIKSRQPVDTGRDTWFLDILDESGCWLMSVPLAMVSGRA